MDADHLLHMVQMSTHPQGEVLIHVVDQDREYWLQIEDVNRAMLGAIPWVDGAVIEARPIPFGPRASRAVTTPRPYFGPHFTPRREITTLPEPEQKVFDEEMRLKEAASKKLIDDLACKSPEQLQETERTGELKTVYSIDPGEPSEPHYAAARELNRKQINDLLIENTIKEHEENQ